jgi:hypothetical protein
MSYSNTSTLDGLHILAHAYIRFTDFIVKYLSDAIDAIIKNTIAKTVPRNV